MIQYLKNLIPKRGGESVIFDDDRVTRKLANGHTETVRWEALREVAIVTTDLGPFVDDVFWLLSSDDGGCAVPSETEGAAALLHRLQQLPGFDNIAVIEAMGSTNNASFLVWRRTES